MGARCVKNVSAIQGKNICGRTFQTIKTFGFFRDNSCIDPGKTDVPIGARVYVDRVFWKNNLPDGGTSFVIYGKIGDKTINIGELFTPPSYLQTDEYYNIQDPPFEADPKYLKPTDEPTKQVDIVKLPLPNTTMDQMWLWLSLLYAMNIARDNMSQRPEKDYDMLQILKTTSMEDVHKWAHKMALSCLLPLGAKGVSLEEELQKRGVKNDVDFWAAHITMQATYGCGKRDFCIENWDFVDASNPT